MLHKTKRVLLVENPNAGASDKQALLKELREDLLSQGFLVEQESKPESIQKCLRAASEENNRFACVICAGGDGTIGMVANWADPTTPLAILPLGTENVLAKQLGFNHDIKQLIHRIISSKTFSLDAGEANGQLFLAVASVGFDAEVVRLLSARRTGHIDHTTWIRPILQALRGYQFPKIRVQTEGNEKAIHTRWAFIFNVPRYALGLRFVAEGDCADGQLDLCCFRGGRWWNGLRYFVGVLFGWHRAWRDTHVEQVTQISIESDEPVPYQLDGDPGGELPVTIRVLPGRLTFVGISPAMDS